MHNSAKDDVVVQLGLGPESFFRLGVGHKCVATEGATLDFRQFKAGHVAEFAEHLAHLVLHCGEG